MPKDNNEDNMKASSLYDTVQSTRLEKSAYYRLLVQHKEELIFDIGLIGQKDVAEKLNLNPSQLSAIMNILKVL